MFGFWKYENSHASSMEITSFQKLSSGVWLNLGSIYEIRLKYLAHNQSRVLVFFFFSFSITDELALVVWIYYLKWKNDREQLAVCKTFSMHIHMEQIFARSHLLFELKSILLMRHNNNPKMYGSQINAACST